MGTDQENSKRIARYLAGELSSDERSDFENWRKESDANEKLFREALKIWEHSGKKLQLPEDETDLQWHDLRARMDDVDAEGKIISMVSRHSLLLKIAASIILLVGFFYIFLRPAKNEYPLSSASDDIIVSSGNEVATIYLPDSSRVWLNTNSSLSYSKDFGKNRRAVRLAGEGYFEVTPDKNIAFSVATRRAKVSVTGTAFNIKEQPEEVIVIVSEGTVEFSKAGAADEEKIAVKGGEKAITKENGTLEKSKNNDTSFASWRKENNPEFEKEKLNSKDYLSTSYSWKKNKINQSVIAGSLKNRASLADYKNIVLKVTYTKPNGRIATARIVVSDTIKPGETLSYQKRLLDIFTDTRSLEVHVESAEVVEKAK